jgi:hypothetical protein
MFYKWSFDPAANLDKAPTRIAYAKGTQNVTSWGFGVDEDDPHTDAREYFKLHLDPSFREYEDVTHDEAKQWYRDYLACVYGHISSFFQRKFPRWATMRVEWIFTVPTTWKNAGLIRELEAILVDAGFTRGGGQHTCAVTLTEAEAAAISGAGQHMRVRTDSFELQAM